MEYFDSWSPQYYQVDKVESVYDVCHCAKFRTDRSNRCRYITFYFKMSAIRHLGFVIRVFEPPMKYLMVFVTMQNLVGIDAVVPIICKFNILHVRLKNACSRPQNWLFWGNKHNTESSQNSLIKTFVSNVDCCTSYTLLTEIVGILLT